MTEEPYRWVEAIANRREYIETQLASGSPMVALGFRDGILFATLGRSRQKVFEIYDRIAMGAIGHPGDIERLRMAAIELASTEGFTRSVADVSLRRLAYYSLSPVLKAGFEQVFGAPYLARMLFAEIGEKPEDDLFLRVEYDGAIAINGGAGGSAARHFGALGGTSVSTEAMEAFLQERHDSGATLARALSTAVDAWTIGFLATPGDAANPAPTKEALATERQKQLEERGVEAAILERSGKMAIRYRPLTEKELQAVKAA